MENYFNSQILPEGMGADEGKEWLQYYSSLTTSCLNLCIPLGQQQKNSRQLYNWNWYNHCHMLDGYFLICECDSFQSKKATVSSTVEKPLPCTLLKWELVTNSCYQSEYNIVIEMVEGKRVAFKSHIAIEDFIVSLSVTGTRNYNCNCNSHGEPTCIFYMII